MSERLKIVLTCTLLLAVFFLAYVFGQRIPHTDPWELSDLRVLDPIDSLDSSGEITAIYTRRYGLTCQYRLDLLTLPELPEIAISLDADGNSLFIPPDSPSLNYDFAAETIVVTLSTCPANTDTLQITTQKLTGEPLDSVTFQFDAPPPDTRAGYFLAFYNTLAPSASPIQALRRWDGAHTGPRGERHGLRFLLDAAQKYRIPITLLDLLTPEKLSALDALGALPQLQTMTREKLLILPSVADGEDDLSLALSRSASQTFHLPASFSTADPAALPPFYRTGNISSLTDSALHPDPDGLSLETRKALLNAALRNDPKPLPLGGDLAQTLWADPYAVDFSFAYLAARPYLHPAPDASRQLLADQMIRGQVPASLQGLSATDSPLYASAWQFSRLLQLAPRPLQQPYQPILEILARASRWGEQPSVIQSCVPEVACFLSSRRVLAVFGLDGRLLYLFARDSDGTHQLVGPTAQFFLGLGDSSLWQPSAGWEADPGQVSGAFGMPPGQVVRLEMSADTLLVFVDQKVARSYSLLDDGLLVQIKSADQQPVTIPVVIDPWQRFSADWVGRFVNERTPAGGVFGWKNGPLVSIQASGRSDSQVHSFSDALPFLASPENPNQNYPQGIFLPFPVVLVTYPGQEAGWRIQISLKPR